MKGFIPAARSLLSPNKLVVNYATRILGMVIRVFDSPLGHCFFYFSAPDPRCSLSEEKKSNLLSERRVGTQVEEPDRQQTPIPIQRRSPSRVSMSCCRSSPRRALSPRVFRAPLAVVRVGLELSNQTGAGA